MVIRNLFAKGSLLSLRATIFIALSLFIIFCDSYWHCFFTVRSLINTMISPAHFIADAPASLFKWGDANLATRNGLLRENARLKSEQTVLQVNGQKLAFLEQDNRELRSLLQLKQKMDNKYISAEIMSVEAVDRGMQVMVDKGRQAGVRVGFSVLDAYGVLGQVIDVDTLVSRIMLITDNKSAVPVIDTRNGMRTIAVGIGDPNILELAHVPDTADVKVGDVLVTSGIGLKLPAGYAVGVVGAVKHLVGERFAKVTVIPYAHVNASRYVLILWTNMSDEMGITNSLNQERRATSDKKFKNTKVSGKKTKLNNSL